MKIPNLNVYCTDCGKQLLGTFTTRNSGVFTLNRTLCDRCYEMFRHSKKEHVFIQECLQ